ncbi:MAG: hypothetical protein JWR85_34 [Marmoricola sp.]|nr:hypothetical protein [Marmoricola sp.]
MYPSKDARELAILLRISRELDIVGDVSATVDNPSELLAWAAILTDATIAAWRGQDSGHRYLQVTAEHRRAPVHGRVAAVLPCEQHREFWEALHLDQLRPGQTQNVTATDLSNAWSAMPLTPPETETTEPGPTKPQQPLPDQP